MDDSVPDLARAHVLDRGRRAGRNVVSAEVIRFILRPRRGGEANFPTIAFRCGAGAGDPADTAPCEYVASHDEV